jgi:hypothetical protein
VVGLEVRLCGCAVAVEPALRECDVGVRGSVSAKSAENLIRLRIGVCQYFDGYLTAVCFSQCLLHELSFTVS